MAALWVSRRLFVLYGEGVGKANENAACLEGQGERSMRGLLCPNAKRAERVLGTRSAHSVWLDNFVWLARIAEDNARARPELLLGCGRWGRGVCRRYLFLRSAVSRSAFAGLHADGCSHRARILHMRLKSSQRCG